ncbi:MAG TPA: DUF2809 domain-containing protein [Chitinophagaceae bacterium]|jgi:hypothetical protein
MPVFHRGYFILTVLLFTTEVLIGVYMHDAVIRPYGGDFLVVILLYCLVKSFWNLPVGITAVTVLLFAYLVEGLQYIHFINILGLEKSAVARVIMGTSFAWTDMLMYTLGIGLVLLTETFLHHKNTLP